MDATGPCRHVAALVGTLTLGAVTCSSAETRDLASLVQDALHGLRPNAVTVEELVPCLHMALRNRETLTRLPAQEQLVGIDRAGDVIALATGTRSHVGADSELRDRLSREGDGLMLVHNHPSGTGLSAADLGQLTQPGVSAVIAVGHDGSVYAASLGRRYIALQLEGPPLRVPGAELRGHTTIVKFIIRAEMAARRLGVNTLTMDEDVLVSHFNHLVSIALGDAGVIRYRSVLGRARGGSFYRFRVQFMHITEQVRQEIAAELKRRATSASQPEGSAKLPSQIGRRPK